MRTYTSILASSVLIAGSTSKVYYASPTSSLDSLPSTGTFQMQNIEYSERILVSNNFSGPTPTGTLTLLMGATQELCNLAPASSALVGTSGTYAFNVWSAGAKWMTVSFNASNTSSSAFWTSVLESKGNN